MLIGIPASGKTTWTRDYHPSIGYASTDKYIEQVAAEKGLSYNDVFKDTITEATSRMLDEVEEYVRNGTHFVWDQTNMSKKSRAKKLKMLTGYSVVAVVFNVPEEKELAKRLASRPGKTIPQYVLDSMIKSYEAPSLDEGFTKIMIAD